MRDKMSVNLAEIKKLNTGGIVMANMLGDVNDRPMLDAANAHVALALVLDVSGSMSGEKMTALNTAVNTLIKEAQCDDRIKDILDLGIFLFGDRNRKTNNTLVHQGFRAISECADVQLQATDGSTYVVDALTEAVARLKTRTEMYDKAGGAHKPWIVLITDGGFHDVGSLGTVAAEMKKRETEGKLKFFGLGVAGFDRSHVETLTNFSNQVLEVKTANFKEFFSWVGRSMATISGNAVGATTTLPPLQFTS